MHLFDSSVPDFVYLAQQGEIAAELRQQFSEKFDTEPSDEEFQSWNNSLFELAEVLSDSSFKNSHIFLEMRMPLSSARCDVMLVGKGLDSSPNASVIELKQWQYAKESAIRNSIALGNTIRPHPSAQVQAYCNYLKYLHEAFSNHEIQIHGCSFLHNMQDRKSISLLRDPEKFGTLPKEYPLFTRRDIEAFKVFLNSILGDGLDINLTSRVKFGRIIPSTKLLDVVAQVIENNFEWNLLDNQLLVFNTIVSLVEAAKTSNKKFIVLVKGVPGTGKSVLALQLLAYAARQRWRVAHAVGSKAFMVVLQALTEYLSDQLFKNIYNVKYKNQLPVSELFTTFANIAKIGSESHELLDLVIADEAHRLWDFRRVIFQNYNKQLSTTPMIEELTNATKVTAVFLDDNQTVRANEIGNSSYIRDQAQRLDIEIKEIDLNIQFRCSGSKSYTDWVDFVMGFGSKKSLSWKKFDGYDFRILDSMQHMQDTLDELNYTSGYKCRLVAGFCWSWSKPLGNGGLVHDIKHPKFGDWSAPWIEKTGRDKKPLQNQYYKWNRDDSYYSQIGSIYSVQGFEFDYVGLIFGEDLVWRINNWVPELAKNKDNQFKRDLKKSEENPLDKLRNIYRVLLTRGMRGTYVFFIDNETKKYFESNLY